MRATSLITLLWSAMSPKLGASCSIVVAWNEDFVNLDAIIPVDKP